MTSAKSKIRPTPQMNLTFPTDLNEDAIRNFQLSVAKGEAMEVVFAGGKLRLVYR